jgi:hypothetical protein
MAKIRLKKDRVSPHSQAPYVRRDKAEMSKIIGDIRSGIITIRAACFKYGLCRNTLKLWINAFNLYNERASPQLMEVSVIIKPKQAFTTQPSDGGTRIVPGMPLSSNKNYSTFSEKFELDPSVLDEVTGGQKYGILNYVPENLNNPDTHHKGTLIIDATDDNGMHKTLETFNKALKPEN